MYSVFTLKSRIFMVCFIPLQVQKSMKAASLKNFHTDIQVCIKNGPKTILWFCGQEISKFKPGVFKLYLLNTQNLKLYCTNFGTF